MEGPVTAMVPGMADESRDEAIVRTRTKLPPASTSMPEEGRNKRNCTRSPMRWPTTIERPRVMQLEGKEPS